MSDDRWRDSYDAWKLASPYDSTADHYCQGCESDDGRYLHGDRWLCGDCVEESDAALRRPADCIEDLDERCAA